MSHGQFAGVLRYVRRLSDEPGSDRQLLERYLMQRDEKAFVALVERHAGMVRGICRRVLIDPNDADDVLQAAFLVLLNKAPSLRKRDSLAGWLQGVAWRLARKVNAQAERRRARETRAACLGTVTAQPPAFSSDLRCVLDDELAAMPEKYRVPLILCYLEGKTYTEAASQLGWPGGTLCGRLARARVLLRRRLTRRGVALSAATLTAASIEPSMVAARSIAVVVGMSRAYLLCASTRGSASTAAVALARGLLGTMTLDTLKVSTLGLALVCACVASAGWIMQRPAERLNDPARPVLADLQADRGRPGEVRKDLYGDPLPPGALARMGSTQFRQIGPNMVFSDDGKRLVSIDVNGSAMYWETDTGRVVAKSNLPRQRKFRELSPDGKTFAAVLANGVALFETATGRQIRHFACPAVSSSQNVMAFSAEGNCLACYLWSQQRHVIYIYDLIAGRERRELDAKDRVLTLSLSTDGRILCVQSVGQKLDLWDTVSGQVLKENLSSKAGSAISPDGKTLALADARGAVTLLEAPSCRQLAVLQPSPRLANIYSQEPKLAFSPDGKRLAVGGLETLILWDLSSRKDLHRLSHRDTERIVFNADGKTLASAGKTWIRLWDVASGKELHSREGHKDFITHVTVSPDNKLVASSEAYDPALRIWNATTGKQLRTHAISQHGLRDCSFTSDGKLLVSGLEGSLELLDPVSGKVMRRLQADTPSGGKDKPEILVSHSSKNGKFLSAVSWCWNQKVDQELRQLTVWDQQTGEVVAKRAFPPGNSAFPVFTPDGRQVTVDLGAEGRMGIQETRTGRVCVEIPGHVGGPVAISPQGDLGVIGTLREDRVGGAPPGFTSIGFRVFELTTGEEIFHVDERIWQGGFSQDGTMLATVSVEALQLWDALTGALLFRLPWPAEFEQHGPGGGSGFPVEALALAPNGQVAFTSMRDGTILSWDLSSATRPVSLIKGRKLATTDLDNCWSDLAGDARIALSAVYALIGTPEQAVPFLAGRLHPAAAPDPAVIHKLIRDLDEKDFSIREGASKALVRWGEGIEPQLRQILGEKLSPETRNRIGQVLSEFQRPPRGEALRTVRAIHALGRIATAEARALLKRLAAGAPNARETRLAREALED